MIKYHISAVYGQSHIMPNHDEGYHTGVYVVHPDGSETAIGGGFTSDVNRRTRAAIDAFNDGAGK